MRPEVLQEPLSGCLHLRLPLHRDARGTFVKTAQASSLAALGLPTHYPEQFVSTSGRDVVRGLHFSAPPGASAKLVAPLAGSLLDVVVDLRTGSPSFGRWAELELHASRGDALFVPEGFAHGFAVLGESAVMSYAVTAEFVPELDAGVHHTSVPASWPAAPVLSARDAALPSLSTLSSPFVFSP